VGKIAVGVIFNNMAPYFECQINKNALLQIVFWRFCPLGAFGFPLPVDSIFHKHYGYGCFRLFNADINQRRSENYLLCSCQEAEIICLEAK